MAWRQVGASGRLSQKECEMQTVEEAMTVDVLTVRPDEPVTVAARIMRNAGATGLLVVDASGHVAGILTEADLLNPAAADSSEIDDRHGSRNRSWTSIATDLMSREVLGVSRDQPVAQGARPGFAYEGVMLPSDMVAVSARSDADLEAEIRTQAIGEVLGLDPDHADIFVDQGVVTLAGVVTKRREATRLKRRTGKVPGASRVKSSVTSEANTAYPGLVPRFAYFAIDIAKRCERSRERRASPIQADKQQRRQRGVNRARTGTRYSLCSYGKSAGSGLETPLGDRLHVARHAVVWRR